MIVAWTHMGHANDVTAMTGLDGTLFAVSRDSRLWRRDPVAVNVDWEAIGHANDVAAMAGLNDKLFAATRDNRLWWRDPVGVNVNWEAIGHANDVAAMAGLDDKLFAATRDNRLWWRDPVGVNVGWEAIGHANDVRAMTALQGALFAVTVDGRVWRRAPIGTDVDWQAVGQATDVSGLAGHGDRLLIATTSHRLLWCRPSEDTGRWAAWPSVSATPPSTVYPPDGRKWFARDDVEQTLKAQARGRDLSLIELRGWLSGVDPAPNDEPDVHYHLELDAEWLHDQRIDLASLLRPGDVLGYPADDPEAARRRTRPAVIECEVDGWPRADADRGAPSAPRGWATVDGWGPALWPWDARTDVRGVALAVGQYVKVFGSLVTDEPHSGARPQYTVMVLDLGLAALRTALEVIERDPAHRARRLREAASAAASFLFQEPVSPYARDNAGRWNEIHSPDYIEVLQHKSKTRQLHQVMLCAQHGGAGPHTEHATFRLPAPPDRPTRTRLTWREHPTAWTRPETVSGPTVHAHAGGIDVTVAVKGDIEHGRFYQLYELWWEPVPPDSGRLRAAVTPASVGEGRHNVMVSARDSGSGTPVAGRVLSHGNDLAATNVSFAAVWEAGTHTLTVRCDGYPDASVNLRVVRVRGSGDTAASSSR